MSFRENRQAQKKAKKGVPPTPLGRVEVLILNNLYDYQFTKAGYPTVFMKTNEVIENKRAFLSPILLKIKDRSWRQVSVVMRLPYDV